MLPLYYSAADVLIVPSTHEEGFGRVILESLACGTPIVGSNRGGIPDAVDKTVGMLLDITPENIVQSLEYLSTHKDKLDIMKKHTRQFAEKKYSNKNAEQIIKMYE
jgi:glycosyltransferase involved in cell wall biosynthesis